MLGWHVKALSLREYFRMKSESVSSERETEAVPGMEAVWKKILEIFRQQFSFERFFKDPLCLIELIFA